jgi:hypothetical protein
VVRKRHFLIVPPRLARIGFVGNKAVLKSLLSSSVVPGAFGTLEKGVGDGLLNCEEI